MMIKTLFKLTLEKKNAVNNCFVGEGRSEKKNSKVVCLQETVYGLCTKKN